MAEPLANLYLVVAQDCNLDCSYCYAGGGSFGRPPRRMDEATMRRALEVMLPLAGRRLTVSFFGGEPLLNFPLVAAAADAARGLAGGREISFALTTNGTVLDEAMADFIAARIDHLAVSLDGDRLANGGRRFNDGSECFDAILANLERLRCRGVGFALRATVTPDNVAQVGETAVFLAGLGADSVRLVPAHGIAWPEAARRLLGQAMVDLNRRGLAALVDGASPVGCEIAIRRLARELTGHSADRPCEAGGGILAVGADGEVYPCEHFVGVGGFAMGSVHDTGFPGPRFHGTAARFAGCTTATRPACAACSVAAVCGGQCYAEAFADTGRIDTPSRSHCALVRAADRAVRRDLPAVLADPVSAARLRAVVGG